MYSAKAIGRLMSVAVMVLTLFCGQSCFADADSISINFAPQYGAPTGGDLGAVPVNASYWNNMDSSGVAWNSTTDSAAKDYNKSGTITSLINNTGIKIPVSGTWSCSNTYRVNATRPSTDNNAILYYGYLDDTSASQSFTLTSPYFSYDIYYYASTDSKGFRYAQLNVNDYSSDGTKTVYGKNYWGTPVTGDISTVTEGVNYLKASSDYSTITVKGPSNENSYRGSVGALQIVNTANSQSTVVSGDFTWTDSVWTNDLTGTTIQTPDATAVGYRLINNGNTATVNLNGSTVNLSNMKILGSGSITFSNGTTKLGKANTVYNFADFNGTVVLPNVGSSEPQGVVKFNSNVSTSDTVSSQAVIPGAYFIDGSTTSFAQLSGGIISAAPSTATVSEGANLLVTSRVTDNNTRTLTALTTQADYVNNNSLTLSSGMMTLQSANHWVQGGGTITSGYKNASGEYDLYLCALGTAVDMRINGSGLVDNLNGKMNVIKSGSGTMGITNSTNTYTGSTSVLEGTLFIAANLSSTEFYVAKDARLNLGTSSNSGKNKYGHFDFTVTKLSGYGLMELGYDSAYGSVTFNNVENDGSMLQTVYFYGKSAEFNNSDVKAQWVYNSSDVVFNGDSTFYCMEFYAKNKNSITVNDNATFTATTKFELGTTNNASSAGTVSQFVQTGGTVNLGSLGIGHYSNYDARYEISGGTLNIGSAITMSGTTQFKDIWLAVSSSGTLNQSGGTINTNGIDLKTRDSNNMVGTYTMTGGTLNMGANGFYQNITANTAYKINLEGGTITAGSPDLQDSQRASWSTSLAATLTGTKNENSDTRVTFAPAKDYSITWTGTLSGDGGLILDGEGSMTITAGDAGNSYSGGTWVKSGTLNMKGNNKSQSTIGTGDLVVESGATAFAESANVFGAGLCDVVLNGGTLKNSGYLHVNNITLNGGTLNSTNNSIDYGGLDFSTRNGSITVTDDATIDTKIINSSTVTIDVAEGKTFTFTSNSNVRNAKNASSTIIKTGAGTIASSNWFEDKVEIHEGTIKLVTNFGKGNRFAGTLTVYEGGTLDMTAKDSLGYSANACTINIYGGTLVKSAGENETLSNKIFNLKAGTITSTYVNAEGETVDSGAMMDIFQTKTKFNSLAAEGATAENPTVSTVDSKVRLRATESFAIDTEANSKLVFTKVISCVDDSGIARSITKTGNGILEFQADNTYYGGTTINGGTLKLSGEGNIVGSLTMNNDSVLDLTTKNTPLKLDSVALNELSVLKVTLNKEDGILSIDCPLAGDSLDNITLNGTLEVLLTGDILDCGDTKALTMFASANNELLGMMDNVVIDPTGNQLPPSMFLTLIKDGNSAYIQIGVPEPSTWALLILGLAGLMALKKSQKREARSEKM